jgi:hypothetical protein
MANDTNDPTVTTPPASPERETEGTPAEAEPVTRDSGDIERAKAEAEMDDRFQATDN